jgi:hypothetical protein
MKNPIRITVTPSGYQDEITDKWIRYLEVVRIDNAITIHPRGREISVGSSLDEKEIDILLNSSEFEVSCVGDSGSRSVSRVDVRSDLLPHAELIRKDIEDLKSCAQSLTNELNSIKAILFFGFVATVIVIIYHR